MQKKCEKCRTTPDLMFHETGVYASGCPVDGKYAILARVGFWAKCYPEMEVRCQNARFRFMPCMEYGVAVRKKQGSCIHLPDGFGTGFSPDNSESRFLAFRSRLLAVRKTFFTSFVRFCAEKLFFAFKRLKNHLLEIKC